jgi:acyl carrier protein
VGMEIVELIIRVEEEFDIEIEDEEAELLTTPGELLDCIVQKECTTFEYNYTNT